MSELEPGAGARRARPWRDLGIAVGIGAVLFLADRASGSHGSAAIGRLSEKLAVWYEDRRVPVVTCMPGTLRPYTALEGVVFDVPTCWEARVTELLGQQIHEFHDPESRIGRLLVSVERAVTDEDRAALAEELDRAAHLRGARVTRGGEDEAASAQGAPSEAPLEAKASQSRRVVPDSLAEKIMAEGREGSERSEGSSKPGGSAFDVVAFGGELGATAAEGGPPRTDDDGRFVRRTWTWILHENDLFVRIVYVYRADWAGTAIVADEFRRAKRLVGSVRPAVRTATAPERGASRP